MQNQSLTTMIIDSISQDFPQCLFPSSRELIPHLNDVYELELAFYEHQLLSDAELIRNSAYFAKVGGIYTRHFLICTGESLKLPSHASSRRKSFFEKNIFRTGYASHGLFPYRGKFHPQMIKGLINVMGLRPGDTVLDPMMGSGTVLVEASLMGIDSIGIDASPFCRFMADTKLKALTMSLVRVRNALNNYEQVFAYFQQSVGKPEFGIKARVRPYQAKSWKMLEPDAGYNTQKEPQLTKDNDREDTRDFLLLAYLDSAGYAERSGKKSPLDQFKAILERYLFVVEKTQRVLSGKETELGLAKASEGDARAMNLDSATVDGIIFSPPYSFAIDYLQNDGFHLDFFGSDREMLRERMIGLRGRKLKEKYEIYCEDMDRVLAECARVLKPEKLCTIIIGTNENQLSKVLGVTPEKVNGLHNLLAEMGEKHGLKPVKIMSRPITGIYNTMRREYILMLAKP